MTRLYKRRFDHAHRGLTWLAMVALAIVVLGVASVRAVTLTSDEEAPTKRIVPPPPRPIPPPPLPNPVSRLISRIDVLAPHYYRGLTVFPLRLRVVEDHTNYVTLDEALRRRWLELVEKRTAVVPEIFASNISRRPIFLMAGEILAGGKQNRTLRYDTLLLPGASYVPVPVYCVEQRRWTGKSKLFRSQSALAGQAMRQRIASGEGQAQIWEQAAADAKANEVTSESGDLQAVYNNRKVQRRIQDYTSEFKRRLPGGIVGLVLVERSRVVACDIFCNPALFGKLRDKILASYVWHPIRDTAMPKRPERDNVRRFLQRAARAYLQRELSPGGERIHLSGAGVMGNGLIYEESVTHVSLFPGYVIMPIPRPLIRPEIDRDR